MIEQIMRRRKLNLDLNIIVRVVVGIAPKRQKHETQTMSSL